MRYINIQKTSIFKLISFILIGICINACKEPIKVERAFYYWKNNSSELNETEQKTIIENAVKKLYIKFFEIDKNETYGAYPKIGY